MKANYKIFGSLVISGIILTLSVSLAWGAPNQGQNGNSSAAKENKLVSSEEKQAAKAEKVCNRFENAYSKTSQKFTEKWNLVESKRKNRMENHTQKENELKTRLETRRAEIEANFAAHIEKMLSLAKDDAAKAAVAKFQTAMKTAMEARRKSVDAARTAFQAEVQNRIRERNSGVDSLAASSESAMQAAFEKAKADCAAGTDPATVKNTLQETLKGVRGKMQTEKQNMEKVKTQLQAAIQTRNNAIQKANETFKAALEAAKAELEKSYPGTAAE